VRPLRYAHIAWTAARQQLTYRGELGVRAIAMTLFMLVFIALWTTAFRVSGRADLAGFGMAEMVWYLAMTETIMLSTSRVFLDISEEVKAGNLAYTLARPLSYPLYQLANSLGNSAPRLLLNLLTASAVVGLSTRQIAGSLQGLLAFFGVAALALVLDALIAVSIGLLAFWIEEVTPVFWIYHKLLFTVGGLFLPLEMFPDWLRRAVIWLPFQFITYAPARTFVRFEPAFFLRTVAGLSVYIVVLAGIVAGLWWRARSRLVIHGG
jgi:ABC-2 type transport system permease protein